jgi:hypothetical protein
MWRRSCPGRQHGARLGLFYARPVAPSWPWTICLRVQRLPSYMYRSACSSRSPRVRATPCSAPRSKRWRRRGWRSLTGEHPAAQAAPHSVLVYPHDIWWSPHACVDTDPLHLLHSALDGEPPRPNLNPPLGRAHGTSFPTVRRCSTLTRHEWINEPSHLPIYYIRHGASSRASSLVRCRSFAGERVQAGAAGGGGGGQGHRLCVGALPSRTTYLLHGPSLVGRPSPQGERVSRVPPPSPSPSLCLPLSLPLCLAPPPSPSPSLCRPLSPTVSRTASLTCVSQELDGTDVGSAMGVHRAALDTLATQLGPKLLRHLPADGTADDATVQVKVRGAIPLGQLLVPHRSPHTHHTNAHTLTSQHGSHRQCRRNDATELCSC